MNGLGNLPKGFLIPGQPKQQGGYFVVIVCKQLGIVLAARNPTLWTWGSLPRR